MPAPAVAVGMIATPRHGERQARNVPAHCGPTPSTHFLLSTLNGPRHRTPRDSRGGADPAADVPSGRHARDGASQHSIVIVIVIYTHIHPPSSSVRKLNNDESNRRRPGRAAEKTGKSPSSSSAALLLLLLLLQILEVWCLREVAATHHVSEFLPWARIEIAGGSGRFRAFWWQVVREVPGPTSWKPQCKLRAASCARLKLLNPALLSALDHGVTNQGSSTLLSPGQLWSPMSMSSPPSEALMGGKKKARVLEGEDARLLCSDALTEVFNRLPARTLASCRMVCKSWMSLLSDLHFVHEHLNRGQQKLLLFANDRVNDRSLATVLADASGYMYQLSRPSASRSLFVHNSCNGLLCLGDSRGAVELLNPTTGESLVLPTPEYTAGSSQFSSSNWHSLGFCASTKEHKVAHFYPGDLGSLKACCEIFTIGGRAWRQIGSLDGTPMDRGMHVNGTVYYLTKIRYVASSRINCLNLESEKFDVLMLPPRKTYGRHCSLSELQGRLCLLVVDGTLEGLPRTMDILMLDNDDKRSWTHRYHISLPLLMQSCYFTPKHAVSHDGKIWVQLFARSLYCYDPNSNSDELEIACPESEFPFSTHTFVESIVPLRQHYFIK